MTKKQTRIAGAILLAGALVALTFFLPSLFPTRMSRSGFTIVKHEALTRMALSYMVAGITAGFGLALLLWPFGGKKGPQ